MTDLVTNIAHEQGLALPMKLVGRGWAWPLGIDNQGHMALTDEAIEVSQSMEIILRTMPGQRVMRPEFGCRIHDLVFAPNNLQTAVTAQHYVEQALERWEPRIEVVQVDARPNPEAPTELIIEIEYIIKATRDPRTLVFPFYLIPGED